MKEMYLTVTDMTFLMDGEVLGHGLTIAAAAGPERPGELPEVLEAGAVRMGTFTPAGDRTPRGRWKARLEGEDGYTLTFQGGQFLLGRAAGKAMDRREKAAL